MDDELLVYTEAEETTVESSGEGPGGPFVRRGILWGAAFVFLVFLGFAIATGFSGATVTVTPRSALVEVNNEFVASRANTAKIALERITVSDSAEITLPADTTKNIAERASGRIVVYNSYSEKPQRLIKNTRFASPDGLVYRIPESIIIPGHRKADGKVIPGSIETPVYADTAGKEYNIPLTDFTIPGFRTDQARYGAFYARSKTPMEGGYEGVMRVPSDGALSAARAKLRAELEQSVRQKIASSVPEGYLFYDEAVSVSYTSDALQTTGDEALARERAHATLYAIRAIDLEKAITATALPGQADLPVDFPEIGTLRLSLTDPLQEGGMAETLRFRLSGSIRAVWLFGEGELREALVGKQRSDLASVVSAFPAIEKVDLVIRPFWKKSFPDDASKIRVETADVSRMVGEALMNQEQEEAGR
jgi:hypothetical protein